MLTEKNMGHFKDH